MDPCELATWGNVHVHVPDMYMYNVYDVYIHINVYTNVKFGLY